MAAPTVELAAVTFDGVPFSAPYRISRQAGDDEVVLVATVTWTGTLKYWHLRLEGTNRVNGTVLQRQGIVCGLGVRCGADVRSLAKTSGSPFTTPTFHDADFDDRLPSEGDYQVTAEALNEDGWSS